MSFRATYGIGSIPALPQRVNPDLGADGVLRSNGTQLIGMMRPVWMRRGAGGEAEAEDGGGEPHFDRGGEMGDEKPDDEERKK